MALMAVLESDLRRSPAEVSGGQRTAPNTQSLRLGTLWMKLRIRTGRTSMFDCGMFMIKYADFYSRGLDLCFCQENMPYFRLRTAKEIVRLRAD